MSKYIFILSIILLTFSSCALKKISNTLTSKNVYENFYVGENGNQWYIYPIKLSNKSTHFLLDCTLRDGNKDTVTVKYSIITKNQISKPKSITFNYSDGEKYKLDTGEKIFVETNKNLLHLRYTTTMKYDDFKTFFNAVESVKIDGIEELVTPSKSAKKKIIEINRQVISIIDNY